MKAVADKERCKECGLCIAYCSKNAIIMTNELNTKGYKHIKVNEEDCVGCGVCYTVCPDGTFAIVE